MEPHLSTTPFGRRSLTLAHVAAQQIAKSRPPEKAVHKWNVFRAICTAKPRIGVSERALSVLNALLSFYPETVLTGEDLIVFPSNRQLALRAHGMAPATLRRHLACLVDAGLIVRRDSPNGKRYARKDRAGEIELAFGFDLAPLVVRAEEFEEWAEEIRFEQRALAFVRERITICRRDIVKMIATGMEEGIPTCRGGQGPADWVEVHALFRSIVERIPRTATRQALEPLADELLPFAPGHKAALLSRTGKWHATRCSGATSRSGGASRAQTGCTIGQRVLKRHPDGGEIGLGISPCRMIRFSDCSRFGSATGSADSSARV